MQQMFSVRFTPRALPPVCSRALPRTRCVRRAVACRLPPPSPQLAPHLTPSFDSGQGASAFNQLLSFDTSSVTDMSLMFWVRSSPCPASNLWSEPSPARCLHLQSHKS